MDDLFEDLLGDGVGCVVKAAVVLLLLGACVACVIVVLLLGGLDLAFNL